MHTLAIPLWWPALLNHYVTRRWQVGHRLKKKDAERLWLEALVQGIPIATTKRRVSVIIHYVRECWKPDEDAIWKSLLDGLKRARLLVDDSPAWLIHGSVTYEKQKKKGIVVFFEDF
jgi:Holliday junction resolvase RusA-like endonuclease